MPQILESAKRSRKTTSNLAPLSSQINFSESTTLNRDKLEEMSFSGSLSGSRHITVTQAPRGYK